METQTGVHLKHQINPNIDCGYVLRFPHHCSSMPELLTECLRKFRKYLLYESLSLVGALLCHFRDLSCFKLLGFQESLGRLKTLDSTASNKDHAKAF